MDKKDIILQLRKEIAELDMLTKGMEELENVPISILTLAKQKATDIISTLDLLPSEICVKENIINQEEDEPFDFDLVGNESYFVEEREKTSPKEDNENTENEEDTVNNKVPQEKISLGDTLSTQRVKDIRLALSIGERFRFQRMLFGNNSETMNDTINELNTLQSYQDAEHLLRSKFNWDAENNDANDFLKMVERRYK